MEVSGNKKSGYGPPDRRTCSEEHIAIWKSMRNDVRHVLSSSASSISVYTVFPYAPNSSWKIRIGRGMEKILLYDFGDAL